MKSHFLLLVTFSALVLGLKTAKAAETPLPSELAGIVLGMPRDQFFVLKPEAISGSAEEQISQGEAFFTGSTTYVHVDPSADDYYIVDFSTITNSRFIDGCFIFKSGLLAGIKLRMKSRPDSASFRQARTNLIQLCYALWGKEDRSVFRVKEHAARKVGSPMPPRTLWFVLEWSRPKVAIRLDVTPRHEFRPAPEDGWINIPAGILEILRPGIPGESFLEVTIPRGDKRHLLDLVGLDRIWDAEQKRQKRVNSGK